MFLVYDEGESEVQRTKEQNDWRYACICEANYNYEKLGWILYEGRTGRIRINYLNITWFEMNDLGHLPPIPIEDIVDRTLRLVLFVS